MHSRLTIAAVLVATACATSHETGPRPRTVPPFLPVAGPPLARLGEPADRTSFRYRVDPTAFALVGQGTYFATIPGPPAGHDYTLVAVDDRQRVTCIIAFRTQRPEPTFDTAVRVMGRPRWRHSAHSITQLFWWDDAAVLTVGGLEHQQALGVGAALMAFAPGQVFDTLAPPLC